MSVVYLKRGVEISGLHATMWAAAAQVGVVYNKHGYRCTITSGLDGQHSSGSLHYQGKALDFRVRNIHSIQEMAQITREIATALGDNYDVILESPGAPNQHIHIEYDPD